MLFARNLSVDVFFFSVLVFPVENTPNPLRMSRKKKISAELYPCKKYSESYGSRRECYEQYNGKFKMNSIQSTILEEKRNFNLSHDFGHARLCLYRV